MFASERAIVQSLAPTARQFANAACSAALFEVCPWATPAFVVLLESANPVYRVAEALGFHDFARLAQAWGEFDN